MADERHPLVTQDFGLFPTLATDALLLMPAVDANGVRIAEAARRLMRMEDHPGAFDAWCRGFARGAHS